MTFETERLFLRPWCEADAEDLYEYAQDPAVGPAAGWPVHTSLQNSREVIQNVLSQEGTFAICLKTDRRAIGSIGIMPTKAAQACEGDLEIGYWLGAPFWGQGLTPEAVRALMAYAFETLGAHTLWCGYYDGNVKSKRCQEKCGFRFHHTERDVPRSLMGDVRTAHYSRITRDEWLVRTGGTKSTRCSVIIPTRNAAESIGELITRLQKQSLPPEEILVVDSESADETVKIALSFSGVRVIPIKKQDFDHGGTRDMALRQSSADTDFAVFMTQDALPADEKAIENLLSPFSDPKVAAVGGRQVAYPDARAFERHVRCFSYPEESRVWERTDVDELGVGAFLISDAFAAYRKTAYLAVGGFDAPVLTNEDMLMAEKLLRAGYRLAYEGSARVLHSHRLTLAQQYRRNYNVGRVLKRYEKRFAAQSEMGRGASLARSVFSALLREGNVFECFAFAADCAARLAGNRMGRRAEEKERKE